jgi:hypothetical protein
MIRSTQREKTRPVDDSDDDSGENRVTRTNDDVVERNKRRDFEERRNFYDWTWDEFWRLCQRSTAIIIVFTVLHMLFQNFIIDKYFWRTFTIR